MDGPKSQYDGHVRIGLGSLNSRFEVSNRSNFFHTKCCVHIDHWLGESMRTEQGA